MTTEDGLALAPVSEESAQNDHDMAASIAFIERGTKATVVSKPNSGDHRSRKWLRGFMELIPGDDSFASIDGKNLSAGIG